MYQPEATHSECCLQYWHSFPRYSLSISRIWEFEWIQMEFVGVCYQLREKISMLMSSPAPALLTVFYVKILRQGGSPFGRMINSLCWAKVLKPHVLGDKFR